VNATPVTPSTTRSSNPHKPQAAHRGFVPRRLSYAKGRPKLFTEAVRLLRSMQAAKAAIEFGRRFGCCPFRIPRWAVSFPLAACSIAALRFDLAQPGNITDGIAVALPGLATLVIAAAAGGPCWVRAAHDPIPSSMSMTNLPRAMPPVIVR